MRTLRQLQFAGLAVLFCGASLGCSIFPESMQQHQLWKWNRVAAPRQDPFFSVADPVRREDVNREEGQATGHGSDQAVQQSTGRESPESETF